MSAFSSVRVGDNSPSLSLSAPLDQVFAEDLVQRYDVPGPRYTSYPTANLFAEGIGTDSVRSRLRGLDSQAALSLYVHVPFCATVCYYCACNKIITANRQHAVRYLERLHKEIALVAESTSDTQKVEQLHFGGGTPTYLSDTQFEALFSHLRRHYPFAADRDGLDISIEIDPRTVDARRMATLCGLGVNRVSLGIQDFDPAVQKAVNRVQSAEETSAIMATARAEGARSVSVDLIYGLPLQTASSFARTVEQVIELRPDRIALYNYAHLPQLFKTQKQINVVDLPAAAEKLELLQQAIRLLDAAGYRYIGMDHFALPNDSLACAQDDGTLQRNFQGYTTHGNCELIGFGVSAISSIDGLYAQNEKTLDAYCDRVDTGDLATARGLSLSRDDRLRRSVISTLMCSGSVDLGEICDERGPVAADYFASAIVELAQAEQDGLVELSDQRVAVTAKGRFFVRNIAMCFDAYLPKTEATNFSRAL